MMNVDEVVKSLNDLLEANYEAANTLFSYRVDFGVGTIIDGSPFVFLETKVANQTLNLLGPLGLLNGIFDGDIVMEFDVEFFNITRFMTHDQFVNLKQKINKDELTI